MAQLEARAVERRGDGGHIRNEITLLQAARDLAKIDAQISDSRAVGHGEIRGDTDQEFVQGKSLGPKRDQLARQEAGETLHLADGGHAGKNVVGPKDRRQVLQFPRHLRADPGIPRPVRRLIDGTHAPNQPCIRMPFIRVPSFAPPREPKDPIIPSPSIPRRSVIVATQFALFGAGV